MNVPLDLVLSTLERALAVTVLPAAGNPAAKEEAGLGVLFTRWLRDVVDHAVDAERASHQDCRRALSDVAAEIGASREGAATGEALAEAIAILDFPPPSTIAAVREETRRIKEILARAIRAAREDDDRLLAIVIRARLLALAANEIERELSFTRATGIDPDAASVTPLAELLRRTSWRTP